MAAPAKRWLERLAARDGVVLIPLAALLAGNSRVWRGISCGHDFGFHLISWFEAGRGWREGVLYPHWAQSPYWGAGEPRFVFYPPITWMLGAALGAVAGYAWVSALLILICLTASGLATRALARLWLPGANATLAGVIATATPYALFTALERASFAELAAAAWVPLLLLFALKAADGSDLRATLWLAIVLALTWLTNAPAGVMACYLLAFVALVASVLLRAWWPVLRAAVGVVLGLGLAAFYLVSAAYEQRWIAIQQAIDVGMRVADSWLFMRHASADLALHDQVLLTASLILVTTALLAAVGFALALRRGTLSQENRRWWIPIALLIPVITVLQFPIAGPVWNLLPKLQFLQFPWRWLLVLDAPFALFLAAATPLGTRRSKAISATVWTAILLTVVGVSSHYFFQECDDEDRVSNQLDIFHTGTGVDGTDEYAPAGSDSSLLASDLPQACLVSNPTDALGESDSGSAPVWYQEQGSCDDTFTAELWQSEHKRLLIDADHEGFLILRLNRYPAWRITVNGAPAGSSPERADGLVVFPVAAGESKIEVRWMTTPDVVWGRVTSLTALLLLMLGLFWTYRRVLPIQVVNSGSHLS